MQLEWRFLRPRVGHFVDDEFCCPEDFGYLLLIPDYPHARHVVIPAFLHLDGLVILNDVIMTMDLGCLASNLVRPCFMSHLLAMNHELS